MPLTRRSPRHTTTPVRTARAPRTTRTTARPSLKTRLLGPKHATTSRKTRHNPVTATTTTTTTTTRTTKHHGGRGVGTTGVGATPVHHQKRHATMGDKVSGALMKLRGSLTRRPGLKAAGTRRMHGTDGRNRRVRY